MIRTIWWIASIGITIGTLLGVAFIMSAGASNGAATVSIIAAQTTMSQTLPGMAINGYRCPVAGPVSFNDSWHSPRSGGRRHKGQDMMARKGTPLVAMFDGTIIKISWHRGLGGNSIWLQGPSGEAWYYAHMDTIAPLHVGEHVVQGQVVGTVGNTGNARHTPSHLHIQYRPRGIGSPDVNNYVILNAACPR